MIWSVVHLFWNCKKYINVLDTEEKTTKGFWWWEKNVCSIMSNYNVIKDNRGLQPVEKTTQGKPISDFVIELFTSPPLLKQEDKKYEWGQVFCFLKLKKISVFKRLSFPSGHRPTWRRIMFQKYCILLLRTGTTMKKIKREISCL